MEQERDMASEIVHLEKLSQSKAAMHAATAANAEIMVRCDLNWPPADWDSKAAVAMNGNTCVGMVVYTLNENDRRAHVDLAWVKDGQSPRLLGRLLARVRQEVLAKGGIEIGFTRQLCNERMAKAPRVFGKPVSESYRVVIT